MNPHNAKADIEYTEGTNTTHLFEENVALNVPNGILGIGIFCFCVMIPGSFLITKKTQNNKIKYSI